MVGVPVGGTSAGLACLRARAQSIGLVQAIALLSEAEHRAMEAHFALSGVPGGALHAGESEP